MPRAFHDIYASQLAQRKQGYPLWCPEPSGYDEVEVGDVGYLWRGAFMRLFNVTLPANHPDNIDMGVPSVFVPLVIHPNSMYKNDKYFDPGTLRSHSVREITYGLSASGTVLPGGAGIHFSCSDREGAVLVLRHPGIREDTTQRQDYEEYILQNYQHWYKFANDRHRRGLKPGEIILVTGCDKTAEWALAAFSDRSKSANVSLLAGSLPVSPVQAVQAELTLGGRWEQGNSAECRTGPACNRDSGIKSDQTIFIRGYKLLERRFFAPKVIQAAAEPRDYRPNDFDGDDDESVELIIESLADEELDFHPVDAIIQHMFNNSDKQLAIAHDDDWCTPSGYEILQEYQQWFFDHDPQPIPPPSTTLAYLPHDPDTSSLRLGPRGANRSKLSQEDSFYSELSKIDDAGEPQKKSQNVLEASPIPLSSKVDFQATSVRGQVHVKIVQGRSLNVTSKGARPFVVVQFEHAEFVGRDPTSGTGSAMLSENSATADPLKDPFGDGHHPVWNQEVSFDVISEESPVIVHVYDRAVQENYFLGAVQVRPDSRHPLDEWYKLRPVGNQNVDGEIRIQLRFEEYQANRVLTLQDFEILKVIGQGTLGPVFQARKKDTERIYAVKVVSKTDTALDLRNDVDHAKRQEYWRLPFLAGLKFSVQGNTALYLATDFQFGGTLFWHLQSAGRFSEEQVRFYVAELTLALGYLHELNIIYEGLDPENILLDATGHVALYDFGYSNKNSPLEQVEPISKVTEYIAPEIFLRGQGYSKASDFWALGVLFFEMCCGWSPFYAENDQQLYKNICFGKIRFPKDIIGDDSKDFAKRLLNRNPGSRLGAVRDAAELKEHAFFRTIDWNALSKKQILPPFRPAVTPDELETNFDPPLERSTAPENNGIVIAVMGATGTGKTSFVNLVSGSDLPVGMGLESCTKVVQTSKPFNLDGRLVTLIDLPGFDDITKSDTDILKIIAAHLATAYQHGETLAGVIYLHRISDFRMGGISRRNFRMFRELSGENTLKNVAVVTNMWGEVIPEVGEAREEELATQDAFFKPVLDKGAHLLRHENTLESGLAILRHLVHNRPLPLLIQHEIVIEGKNISETAAGAELSREIMEQIKRHRDEIRVPHEEMRAAMKAKDEETRLELEAAAKKAEAKMAGLEADKKTTKEPISGKRGKIY